jgi:hypothetical protein
MRVTTIVIPAFALILSVSQAAWAQPAPVAPTAPMEIAPPAVQISNGAVAKLGANKRVALTGCMVEYQTSVKAQAGGGAFNRNTSTSANLLVAVPKDTLQEVTNRSCANLREKLTKAGYTLVPDAEVKANPVFAQIMALSGVEGVFGTKKGDMGTLLFADAAIPQYLPYIGEGAGIAAALVAGDANYEKALPDAKPAPDGFAMSRKYDLPKLEVELAKALNAHVLKAWTVVGFGGASAASDRDWGVPADRVRVQFKGGADALLSLIEHQTRLAIRLADGNLTGYTGMIQRGPKIAPTDGDIVIKLSTAVLGGNSFFSVDKGDKPEESGTMAVAKGLGAILGGGGRWRESFHFETKISQPEAYRDTAVLAIGAAHDGFVGLMGKP